MNATDADLAAIEHTALDYIGLCDPATPASAPAPRPRADPQSRVAE